MQTYHVVIGDLEHKLLVLRPVSYREACLREVSRPRQRQESMQADEPIQSGNEAGITKQTPSQQKDKGAIITQSEDDMQRDRLGHMKPERHGESTVHKVTMADKQTERQHVHRGRQSITMVTMTSQRREL
jgi:hypothetical protein